MAGLADKRIKKRKGFYKYIQSSIEFYLSDANLRSDSYMRSILKESKEVDPSIFMTFNRILRVGAEVGDILKAVSPSNVLEVTAEGKIRRRFPIVEKSKEDVDWCSIYAEKIPPDATPDDLIKIFSAFGKVAKVTIPSQKIGNKIAGFAFVEYEDFHARLRAIQAFRTYGALINSNQCSSVTVAIDEDVEEDRRLEIDEVTKIENAKLENEVIDPALPVIEVPNEVKTKKNRKKKPKGKIRFMGMEIMSKTTWNRLRNRYLTLQAFNRRRMKVQLSKLKKSPPHRSRLKSLIPGSVVTISLPKKTDETEVVSLRTELRRMENVEYVDVEEDQMVCYVRMNSADAAAAFVASPERLPGCEMSILPPTKEEEYMNKIVEDRKVKFASKIRKNISGKRKMAARAERQLGFKIRVTADESSRSELRI